MTLIDAHEEVVLNKLTKPNSIQLLLKVEATPTACFLKEVDHFRTQFKMLEADIAVVRTINSRPLERLVRIKRKCWENVQYSLRDTLETVSIRNLVDKSLRTICY